MKEVKKAIYGPKLTKNEKGGENTMCLAVLI